MRRVDLRSDTITQPTEAMRRAMAEAEVGDDVFGEDPTVNRLEALAAEKMGKEAAILVASGTMANLVSLLAHCRRGDEVILGDQSHTYVYEQGGSAAIAGVHPRAIANQEDGTLRLEDIAAAVRPDNVHFPRSRLILLENTHNRCYGQPLAADYMDEVGRVAERFGLKIHVDGARIFNAAVALGVEAERLVRHADSVSFCLSKALAAPVGSMVCGDQEFIAEVRRARKVVGGGMRQAGVIAAAGIVAVTEMVDRLVEDHGNARRLAELLAEIDGLAVEPQRVVTNIVYIDVSREGLSAAELAARLDKEGVRLLALGPLRLRAVTTYQVTPEDIDYAAAAFRKAVSTNA